MILAPLLTLRSYVNWAVKLALSLEDRQPWIMCVQDDAPNATNLVNTCNGFYCDNWLPGKTSLSQLTYEITSPLATLLLVGLKTGQDGSCILIF